MAHEDTLKNNWGLNKGTKETTKKAATMAEIEADERLRERKRAAMATGVNPDTITADNDPAVVKKLGKPTFAAVASGFVCRTESRPSG